MKRGKNLAFSKDKCRKVKSAIEGPQEQLEVGLKWRRELNKRMGTGSQLEKDPFRRRKPHISLDLEQITSAPVESELLAWPFEGTDGQVVKLKRASDEGSRRSRKIMNEKREKKGLEWILQNTSTNSKRARSKFCDFDKPRKRAGQKRKIWSNELSNEESRKN